MKAKMGKDTKCAPVSYFTFRRFPFIPQSIRQSYIVPIFVFGNLQNQKVGNYCEQIKSTCCTEVVGLAIVQRIISTDTAEGYGLR